MDMIQSDMFEEGTDFHEEEEELSVQVDGSTQ